ncbi:hypothetical protein N7466_004297 [Penicillium verhagenii]|uniref:uncharacterized protein n=1 Tax=Penicillium verhagenii TaxID=1562060 RepID=UPI002544EF06|nr:uncharacterized protein N7466_004297 [Penicillium verhagenii]KAJ5934750.1 hypothetical protein N7466_004297 [Penicillium verhagenii]
MDTPMRLRQVRIPQSVSPNQDSGYVFKLAGAAISWQSRKQTAVTLSSKHLERANTWHKLMPYRSTTLKWLLLLLSDNLISDVKSLLKIKDMGDPTKFLGSYITKTEHEGEYSIELDQAQYARDLLSVERMEDAKPTKVPATIGTTLPMTQDDINEEQRRNDDEIEQLRSRVGKLGWLS